ncbi:MAG TPA: 16S rRNA (cytidine(1402)-2'-O)-methyltransferase [Alphaproteobacteria bacterium]|nr:16S rRNA (cytidine(1402)-2'-O)-methyltransferase [Alphaproteobacteria bacterium]
MDSVTADTGGSEPSECSRGSKPQHARAKGGPVPPGLYLVATPIGNLGDITLRALEVLRGVALIACEDTRVTGKLLAAYGISARLSPYHEHNAERARPKLLAELARGAAVALVSDAGTPLVSDPGHKLVREALALGLPVTAVPGASAVLTALALSALPSERFLFAGFLPAKAGQRRKTLAELAAIPATLVLFETAPRLANSLADMAELLGERTAAVARELTKLYEEVRRGPLAELARHYREAGPPKGELVVVVGPPKAKEPPDAAMLDRMLEAALSEASLRDAAERVAAASGLARRRVYARALELAKRRGGQG